MDRRNKVKWGLSLIPSTQYGPRAQQGVIPDYTARISPEHGWVWSQNKNKKEDENKQKRWHLCTRPSAYKSRVAAFFSSLSRESKLEVAPQPVNSQLALPLITCVCFRENAWTPHFHTSFSSSVQCWDCLLLCMVILNSARLTGRQWPDAQQVLTKC